MSHQTIDTILGVFSALMVVITALGNALPASKFQRICLAIGVNGARFYAELHGKADPTASTKTTAGASSNDPASDALLASAAQLVASQKQLAEAVAKSSAAISEAPIEPARPDSIPTNPSTPSSKMKAANE